jgi:hypothetical protein
MVQHFWKAADEDRDGLLTLTEFTVFMKKVRVGDDVVTKEV